MRAYPNIIEMNDEWLERLKEVEALIDGRYVPARAMGWQSFSSRLHAAWLVFTGRADALRWIGQ